MVIVSPLRIGLWDPIQMAVSWLINGGDPNYLLTGMILQVGILAHRTPDDEQGVYFFTSEKGKVFRFHETILRRWARIRIGTGFKIPSHKTSMTRDSPNEEKDVGI